MDFPSDAVASSLLSVQNFTIGADIKISFFKKVTA